MKLYGTAHRSRRSRQTLAPSFSALLRTSPQTKHPVTDRTLRSPSHIHHPVATCAADDAAAPVHIHVTGRCKLILKEPH